MSTLPHALPDVEQYRQALYIAAQLDLDPCLIGKLDLSGVMQQTMLEAHTSAAQFRGRTESEVLAWLRRIMAHNLIDAIRRHRRAGYDATLEQSLYDSSMRLEAVLSADDTPPVERAIRNEELLRLTSAMSLLTDDQRLAVTRHHLQGATLVDVAIEMGRSKEAVAGLIHRGMMKLRELFTEMPKQLDASHSG